MPRNRGPEVLDHRDRPFVIDPDKTYADLPKKEKEELATRVWIDWDDAQRARRHREDRANTDLRIYMRQSRDVETARADRKGWSKMEVPMCFWLVETLLARSGVNPPAIVARARSPEAQPWALARELRLRHYMDVGNWRWASVQTGKRQLIFGDAPEKLIWDPRRGGPVRIPIDWYAFWMSPEAAHYRDAEYLCYVTFWRPSTLERRCAYENDQRAKLGLQPTWVDYREAIETGTTNREDIDKTYAERLDITRNTMPDPNDRRAWLVPVCEFWYDDGSYVTAIIGRSQAQVIRAQTSPFKWPGKEERPLRPFTMYSYTPTPTVGPYSMSVPQIVGDHQIELSTLRNMNADALAALIAAPTAYMDDIPEDEVREGFSAPGGMIPVPHGRYSDVSQAIQRLQPGSVNADLGGYYDQIRSESQTSIGLTDIAAAQSGASGLPSSTATGASIIAGEQNQRIQLLLWQSEEAAGPMGTAGHMDAMDRQFGQPMVVDVEPGFSDAGASGIVPVGGRAISPEDPYSKGQALVQNGQPPEAAFEIVVDAGAAARADESEAAQRTLIAADILANNPAMAPLINWQRMTEQVLKSLGLPAESLMTAPGANTPAAAPAPGPAQGAPPPGMEVPLGGEPVPNGANEQALAGVGPPPEEF